MSVYSVNAEPTIIAGREETKHVFCNGSDAATGGGWAMPPNDVTVTASYPHSNGSGWTVVFSNDQATGSAPVDLYVICAELG